MARTPQRLKIDVPFEDAIRKILKAGPMPKKPPTYKAIQAEVKRTGGFVAQTCWIADVLRQMGYLVKTANNRHGAEPVKPCLPAKRSAIQQAIRKLSQ